MSEKHCIDCDTLVDRKAVRCRHCNMVHRYKTTDTAQKISEKLLGKYTITCEHCKTVKKVRRTQKNTRFCSRECRSLAYDPKVTGSLGGRISAERQNRRSRNEIMFANLCIDNFNNVLCNAKLFNGWDADIVLPEDKIAILWNGNWHHTKLSEKHSVAQVQNRDRIKLIEIRDSGYTPYVIDDYGKANDIFVKGKFTEFITWRHNLIGRVAVS